MEKGPKIKVWVKKKTMTAEKMAQQLQYSPSKILANVDAILFVKLKTDWKKLRCHKPDMRVFVKMIMLDLICIIMPFSNRPTNTELGAF